MRNMDNDDYIEVDVPLSDKNVVMPKTAFDSQKQVQEKAKSQSEDDYRRQSETEKRNQGYKILKLCIFFVMGIHILNILLMLKDIESSSAIVPTLEILKTVILFVLGYLFGKEK